MKKKIFLLTFIITLLSSICFGSTNTYPRTEDNLQIWSDINVTSSNKQIILNTPKVNENEKIYDFANLLSTQEEENLYLEITEFIQNHNYDMVVVTINYNNKNSARDYADDFYDYNYFGKGTNYDGILFLIDMDTREMWISTTGDCINMYNDYRIDKILDNCYSYISRQDYYKTAKSFITTVNKYANNGYPNSEVNNYYYNNDNNDELTPFSEMLKYSTVTSFIITLIIIAVAFSKHRTIKKATSAIDYFDRADFEITQREDLFIGTHTDKVYDPPSSSSSSGGSSTHRSSSGRSHGGGGRRF